MKLILLLAISSLLLLSCENNNTTETPLLNYIPNNTSVLIKINNYTNLQNELKNNAFLSKIKNLRLVKQLNSKIELVKLLTPESESLLAFTKADSTGYNFFYLVKDSINTFKNLENTIKEKKIITYKNSAIYQFKINKTLCYSTTKENYLFFSSSKLLLENLLDNKPNYEGGLLKKLYNTASNSKSGSIFINTNLFPTPDIIDLKNATDWVSLDINTISEGLHLTGISITNDSLPKLINLFKNTSPITNSIQEFSPANTDAILSYTFNDYSVFAANRHNYLKLSTALDTIFTTVEEIGAIYFNSKKAIVLQTYGADNINEYLNTFKESNISFKGYGIIKLNNKTIITNTFNPLFKKFNSNYFTIIENAFIFSEELVTLENIIDNYKNGTTYAKTAIYKSAKKTIANESSVLYITNPSKLKQEVTSNFSENFSNDFNKINFSDYFFAGQVVADNNFYHTNIIVQKIKKESKKNTISTLFTTQLDNDLATDPQFVINHRTNTKEIVVQDIENQLYLIAADGKVIWKKQLNGRIQGKIQQVDIYKNGRLQLAFTTDNQFLILDRNGKEVNPFTLEFSGGNLNSLAIFDYSNNKDYRFVVTQSEKIFMYNRLGKIVTGFTYTKAKSPILKKPKHFRVKNKDYLIFTLENGDLKILNRTGKERIKVSKKIDFSENEIQYYKNKFSITDKKGVLHQIALNGKKSTAKFNINADHGFNTTSRALVIMNENTLTIKGKKVVLEVGVYTKPQILFRKNKMYISITDIQNQKNYLFDSYAKSISNFPVYGSSKINLADIDNDNKLELVSKDADNSIIVYRIN